MRKVKQALGVFALALAVTLVTGFVGFLQKVHLELSFNKLKDFKATDLSSYARLGAAIRFDVETADEQDFTAFYAEDDQGIHSIRKSDVSYNVFSATGRIEGTFKDRDDEDNQDYVIGGFYNSDRLMFSYHSAPTGSALGTFVLEKVFINKLGTVYGGYAILEEVDPGMAGVTLSRCPAVLVSSSVASKQLKTGADAAAAMPFLNNHCVSFQLPPTLTAQATH